MTIEEDFRRGRRGRVIIADAVGGAQLDRILLADSSRFAILTRGLPCLGLVRTVQAGVFLAGSLGAEAVDRTSIPSRIYRT